MNLPVKVFSRKNTTLHRRCTSRQIINSPSCGTDCEITCGLRGRRREWIIVGTNAKLGIPYRYCDLNRLSLAVLLHSPWSCEALLVSLRHGLKRKQCIHRRLDDLAEVCVGPGAVFAEIHNLTKIFIVECGTSFGPLRSEKRHLPRIIHSLGPTGTLNCEARTRSCEVLQMTSNRNTPETRG